MRKCFVARNIDFATFLEILHQHESKTTPRAEVLQAFSAHERNEKLNKAAGEVCKLLLSTKQCIVGSKRVSKGIKARQLRSILCNSGEHLTLIEVDRMLREAGIHNLDETVNYEHFVATVLGR